MPVYGNGRAILSEEQRVIVANLHGGHRGQKPCNVLRIKMAGSRAIVLKALPPSLTRIISTDIVFETYVMLGQSTFAASDTQVVLQSAPRVAVELAGIPG
jgi:hypothetical protein